MARRRGAQKSPERESAGRFGILRPAATLTDMKTEPSACGLPSHVIIDKAKTPVQRSDAEWKKLLTPMQFRVARQQGTEPPFQNEFWNSHANGVYFSVCSETPLF